MTDKAGYTMAVTAKRDGLRLLAIVLGEQNGKVRNIETSELLDYGFNNYEAITIKNKGDIVGEITLDKANPGKINVMVKDDVTILKRKTDEKREYNSEVRLNTIKLPIKKGEIIGKLLIKDSNNIINEVDLVSDSNMERKSFLELWFNTFKSMFTGDII
jgi:D-alanyl-D-alanine carboxypeptidase (penicillin-binding protein 5/6)